MEQTNGRNACRVCGFSGDSVKYRIAEVMYRNGETFCYFECASCGCLQIDKIPPDMGRYYGANYYSYQADWVPKFNSVMRRLIKKTRDRYAIFGQGLSGMFLYGISSYREMRTLAKLSLKLEDRILDVGCGDGLLAWSLVNIGFKNISGIDPYIGRDINYSNGLRIGRCDIENVSGMYDLVMFHHSLEHVTDPCMTMRCAANLLVPGGRCLVRTPTVSSYAWRHYGANWVQLDAPRHLYVHSNESMRILADKSGLVLSGISNDSTAFQFWGSELVSQGIPINGGGGIGLKMGIIDKYRFTRKANKLNAIGEGDSMVAIMRKPI